MNYWFNITVFALSETAVIAQLAVRRPQDRWVVGSTPAEWHPIFYIFSILDLIFYEIVYP